MLLYNQTKQARDWDGSGRRFHWDPWGSCEVPDELVPHIFAQRVPVAEAPVPPERKAKAVADGEVEALRSDEVLKLRSKLELAEADMRSARETIAEANSQRSEVEAKAKALEKRCASLDAELATARADTRAAEELVQETARKLELLEQKTAKATKKGDAKSPQG